MKLVSLFVFVLVLVVSTQASAWSLTASVKNAYASCTKENLKAQFNKTNAIKAAKVTAVVAATAALVYNRSAIALKLSEGCNKLAQTSAVKNVAQKADLAVKLTAERFSKIKNYLLDLVTINFNI